MHLHDDGSERNDPFARDLAMRLGSMGSQRLTALLEVEREGGLSRFETKMLRIARRLLEREEGEATIALWILCELATEIGFKANWPVGVKADRPRRGPA